MSRRLVAAARVAAVYPICVVGLILLTAVAPSERGPLALVPIVAPHLLISTMVLVPPAIVVGDGVLRVALLLTLLTGAVLLGDEWLSWPRAVTDDDATPVALVSWNLQAGARTPDEATAAIRELEGDVVALQELTYEAAAAIEADDELQARFPNRVLVPDRTVLGLGLLSKFPITSNQLLTDPGSLMVRLELGGERPLVVLNVHPLPGRIGVVSFDGTTRNGALRLLRGRVDRLLTSDEPLVVIGDLNVASTEPAYRTFSMGLRDTHLEVGQGAGWTWRPPRLGPLGIGLLRIDYVLVSPSLVPQTAAVDCSRLGDHCVVKASIMVP